ncbi:MAG: 3-keto-5-aminohexanoate cleavage protein [Solirubrobacterales bacterium]|nr:3-keto-5-aminohexanoate cleavage protein [Solirubrobacterales bacterium]
MADPVIITVAPTGPLTTRKQHPGVPLSPTEIAEAVAESAEAGAAVAHVHARDEHGKPTADPAVYAAIAEEIRARCDIVVQASTGVGLAVPWEERLKIISSGEVDVTMATLNPAWMTFADGTFSNPPEFVQQLAEAMHEHDIHPELEVYDVGHLSLCRELVDQGLIRQPLQFSFVMGVRGGMPGDPALLPLLRSMLPEGSVWQAIGIVRSQLPLSFAALAMGGNIRVGFEDNVYFEKGALAESNAQFVRRAVELVGTAGREPATPDDVRKRLGVR